MKFIFFGFFLSGSILASELSLNAFKVDTSIQDIKPVKKNVTEKILPDEPIRLGSSKEYRPDKVYQPMINPFSRPDSEFGLQSQEQRNQAARGIQ
jgi:hypothetical protein